ncbi:MAG: metallophosphoesterase family protein [Planctomycetaceae bacterium]|nr:metallophosphoesterase family protein [Planctomycetaceae bacterium]
MKHRLCIAGVLTLLAPSAFAITIVAGPWLQNPSPTSMTVMWVTDTPAISWVEYGGASALDRKAFSSHHGLVDAGRTIHTIALDGLAPGTEYKYRPCSKEILEYKLDTPVCGATVTGPDCTFRTLSAAKDAFSFIVFNDIHQRIEVLKNLFSVASAKPYDLVFLNGDMLDAVKDEPQLLDAVFRPCSELFAKTVPLIYVRGNHETRGPFARMLPDYVATPAGTFYYSFDHGPVHFIAMDSGEDKADSHGDYAGLADFDRYRDEQRKWLETEIQTDAFKNAAFRVALIHMPTLPSKNEHGSNDIFTKWTPLFNQGKLDLLICGHTHRHEILEAEPPARTYPIVIGGCWRQPQQMVIRVDVTRDNLDVTLTCPDNTPAGTYTIPRRLAPPASSPH